MTLTQTYHLFYYCLLSTFSAGLFSQVNVYDYSLASIDSVLQEDPGLYQSIGSRFLANDTTLTGEEYIILYYGSAYVNGYQPYSESTASKAANAFLEEKKFKQAKAFCEESLSKNPSFAEMYYLLAEANAELGDSLAARIAYEQFYGLITIPIYSGNGMSIDSAFVVRSVRDEYIIMDLLDYQYQGSQGLVWTKNPDIPYDMMTVKAPGKEEEIKLYFNIYQPYLLGLAKLFSDDKSEKSNKKKDKKKRKKKRAKKKDDN